MQFSSDAQNYQVEERPQEDVSPCLLPRVHSISWGSGQGRELSDAHAMHSCAFNNLPRLLTRCYVVSGDSDLLKGYSVPTPGAAKGDREASLVLLAYGECPGVAREPCLRESERLHPRIGDRATRSGEWR